MALDDETNIAALTEAEAAAAKEMEEQGEDYFKDVDPVPPVEEEAAAEPVEPAQEAAAPEDAPETEEIAPDEAAEPAAPSVEEPFAPHLGVDTPVDEIEKQISALDNKFDEGEIEAVDYRTQLRQLEKAAVKAELANEINEQTSAQRWEYAQEQFYSGEGNDVFRSNAVMRGALDGALKGLYSSADHAGRTGTWYLNEAAKQVREQLGAKAEAPASPAPPAPTVKATGRGKAAESVPQTLGSAPAAENNTDGGEFASLEGLNGVEYEAAFARLTVDQQDRYLRG